MRDMDKNKLYVSVISYSSVNNELAVTHSSLFTVELLFIYELFTMLTVLYVVVVIILSVLCAADVLVLCISRL